MVIRLGALLVILGVAAWLVAAADWPKAIAPECATVAAPLFVIGLIIVIGAWAIERFLGRDVP